MEFVFIHCTISYIQKSAMPLKIGHNSRLNCAQNKFIHAHKRFTIIYNENKIVFFLYNLQRYVQVASALILNENLILCCTVELSNITIKIPESL